MLQKEVQLKKFKQPVTLLPSQGENKLVDAKLQIMKILKFNGRSKSLKLLRLPSKCANSRQVANKHSIETVAPQSSICIKKLNWRLEPQDGATSDYLPQRIKLGPS